MLHQLQENEAEAVPDLPIRGERLSNLVSVLLKTSDEGDTTTQLAKFIH